MTLPKFIETWNISKHEAEHNEDYNKDDFCECHNWMNNDIER